MASSPIETLPGDVLQLIARELTTKELIHLRDSSTRLRANNHLKALNQQRLIARPIYDDGVKRLELRDGQLYEGYYEQPNSTSEITLEHVTFFRRKPILKVWGTPVDTFVWCGMEGGLYQVKRDKRPFKLDQFDGMTPVNFIMAPHLFLMGHSNYFHFQEGLYVSGLNNDQQLGLGPNARPEYDEPERVEFFNNKNIIQVLSSGATTYVHCTDGLYSFGRGLEGQLGLGDFLNNPIPTRIDFFNDKTIKQIAVKGEGVFVLCEDALYQFGTPINIANDPVTTRHSHPIIFTDTAYADVHRPTTVLRLEANVGHRNPLAHCTDGVYEMKPIRQLWGGMPQSLVWCREYPHEASIKPAQPLIQQACSKLIQRYLKRFGKFHKDHATDLNSRLLHCDGSVESLQALIEGQLALYKSENTTRSRRHARYDPSYFSTELRHKSKGPKGSYYDTLKKCQALLESVAPQAQVAGPVHL